MPFVAHPVKYSGSIHDSTDVAVIWFWFVSFRFDSVVSARESRRTSQQQNERAHHSPAEPTSPTATVLLLSPHPPLPKFPEETGREEYSVGNDIPKRRVPTLGEKSLKIHRLRRARKRPGEKNIR